jgi:hypothetical protein
MMSETHHGSFTFADFRLQNGEVLPEVTIAYATRGKLAADRRNAVLVTHGYTSGQRMIESGAGSSEGAWSTLVGPGAPIDTDRCFVVCSNMLGSSYGSTNAASRDPRTLYLAGANKNIGPLGQAIPNITPDKDTGIGDWKREEITELLLKGIKPDLDNVQGLMEEVIQGAPHGYKDMTKEDALTIADYLKSIPALKNKID